MRDSSWIFANGRRWTRDVCFHEGRQCLFGTDRRLGYLGSWSGTAIGRAAVIVGPVLSVL